jgi:uncharacterized circularly permuted ATP-grasp superfamily protein
VRAARPWDEARDEDGGVRPHYAPVLDALAGRDLAALRVRLDEDVASARMFLGTFARPSPFAVDPVPRILTDAEWREIEAGLAQRVRALDAFVADAQGPRRAVVEGVVPAEVLAGCVHDEPQARDLPPAPVRVGIAGIDLVRDPSGAFRVLEDNVRAPAGVGVVLACGAVVRRHVAAGPPPRGLDGLRERLRAVLAAAAGVPDPTAVLLHDRATSTAAADVGALATLLAIPAVDPTDLAVAGDRLVLRDGGRPVDVVYRRTSEDRLRRDDGGPTELAELLLGPLRAGTVHCVNAFGSGVADDKRVYGHVEDLIRLLLGEEPILCSVATYDLTAPAVRAEVVERLGELVVKPRGGTGGHGVLIGPRATAKALDRARRALLADPTTWVVQDPVLLSTHPTVIDGALRPRHVDLRAFVLYDGRDAEVVPSGLSRFPLAAGELVVNSSQGGGTKDTWVLPPS